MTNSNPEQLVDIAAVCNMLGIGDDQLRNHRNGRSLRPFPAPAMIAGGRSPLWRVSDVEAWAVNRPRRGRPATTTDQGDHHDQ